LVVKALLPIAIALIVALNIFSVPHLKERSNALLFVNALAFRTFSMGFHNLFADKLWLLSTTISEIKNDSKSINEEEFIRASRSIIALDPYFYESVNYAATYLVSVKKDLPSALQMLRDARFYDSENFFLYYLEILFVTTYGNDYGYPMDIRSLKALAQKANALPDSQKILGQMIVKDWVDELLILATNQALAKRQSKEDLKWLLKNTQNPAQKKAIEKRLSELQHK